MLRSKEMNLKRTTVAGLVYAYVIILTIPESHGTDYDYPCQVWSASSDTTVTLNGFPILDRVPADKPGGVSFDALPFLQDGTNTITYSYEPVDPTGENPQQANLTIGLKQRTQGANNYGPIVLYDDLVTAGTLSTGTYSSTTHLGTSAESGGGYAWEFEWPAADEDYPIFDYIPHKLGYRFSPTVSSLDLSFSNAEHTVVYEDVELDGETGTIDVLSMTPSSGEEYESDNGFCKIKFAYSDPDEAVGLSFILQGTPLSDVDGFPIQLPLAFSINSETMAGGNQVSGSMNMGNMVSEVDGDDHVWEFEFTTAKAFDYISTSIKYVSDGAATLDITFSDGATTLETYSDLSFSDGDGTIDLTQETAVPGTHLEDDGFKRLKIKSDEAEFKISMVFLYTLRDIVDSYDFNLSISQTWNWESAATIGTLSGQDKSDMVDELIVFTQGSPSGGLWYHMNQEDAESVVDCFEYKIKDIAAASGKSVAALEAIQEAALDELFDMTTVGQVMESLDPDDDEDVEEHLTFTVLSNNKVVHVTHADFFPAIKTEEFSWDEEDLPEEWSEDLEDTFGIDVFFAKVDTGGQTYEWKLIR